MHFALFDVAARFNHLKPAKVLDGFVRAFNGAVHGFFNRGLGSSGEFGEFINGIFHVNSWGAFPPV